MIFWDRVQSEDRGFGQVTDAFDHYDNNYD